IKTAPARASGPNCRAVVSSRRGLAGPLYRRSTPVCWHSSASARSASSCERAADDLDQLLDLGRPPAPRARCVRALPPDFHRLPSGPVLAVEDEHPRRAVRAATGGGAGQQLLHARQQVSHSLLTGTGLPFLASSASTSSLVETTTVVMCKTC